MKFLKKIVWRILHIFYMDASVNLFLQSALIENGWFKSFRTKQAVDKKGLPIPWCTYPFIDFITSRLNKDMKVFEFGCGNSTLWYANKVNSIKAVEHNQEWHQMMQKKLPANASVVLADTETNYANCISDSLYDIVIIDGIWRNECVNSAIKALSEQGIIIIDNSDRVDYQQSYDLLKQEGFKRLDFWGMCPIITLQSCTSIFYKPNNCLII